MVTELRARAVLASAVLSLMSLPVCIVRAQESGHPADGFPWRDQGIYSGAQRATATEEPADAATGAGSAGTATPNNMSVAAEQWSTVPTSSPPPGRILHTAIYPRERNWMVVFGGRGNQPGPWYSDSWALDLDEYQWVALDRPGTRPGGRDRHSAVYDEVRDRMIIYSGYGGSGTYYDDVWALDLASGNWDELVTSGPPPHYRNGHAAVYDSADNKMLVFGGYYYSGSWRYLYDLWSLDLETLIWVELSPSGTAPPLGNFQTAYDATSRLLYVYGGTDPYGIYYPDRVWRLDLASNTWEEIVTIGAHPGPKDSFSLIHDEAQSRLVMYGGHHYDGSQSYYYDDIWALDLTSLTWQEIEPVGDPPVLELHSAVHDGHGKMFAFGGLINASSTVSAATFLLDWTNVVSNHPPQADAGADAELECTSFVGAIAHLDGSSSSDPDSSPGTNDDIVLFEWFEDFGLPSEQPLGDAEEVDVTLALGVHSVTLRVTDGSGETSTDNVVVGVFDTTPPTFSVAAEPALLWPPDHRMVDVAVSASVEDVCGGSSVTLTSVSSMEGETVATAVGGAVTVGWVQGAEFGTSDYDLALKAERAGSGPGRVYSILYTATDPSGNHSTAEARIVVPHDLRRDPKGRERHSE